MAEGSGAGDGGGKGSGGKGRGGRGGKKAPKAKAEGDAAEAAAAAALRHRGRPPQAKNALFEQCYRGRIVPEEEWEEFMASLDRELPVTFRFAVGCPLATVLAQYMEREFLCEGALDAAVPDAGVDGATGSPGAGDGKASSASREPLAPLPWLPMAWKLDLPKAALRKAPGPKRLHALLKQCTELGAISRQEAVSMVPASLLDYSRGLRVLDLCAAPGMKSLQLLDMTVESSPASGSGCTSAASILKAGAVVSNELDGRRCCMLAHHVLRSRSPAGLVVHHNALALPPLGGEYDRVLCDVPCSGDGTIRKAPQLLAGWRPNRPSALHGLQLRIACAGASRLAPEGRMVYSTCAFSPIENEAVVAALLLRADGALELVDCSDALPSLQRRPGLEQWEVPAGARRCRAAVFLQNPEEARSRDLDVPATAWPPAAGEAAAARLGLPAALRRCLRMYPHRGDSGGFFVAVLRRVAGTSLPTGFTDFGEAEGAKCGAGASGGGDAAVGGPAGLGSKADGEGDEAEPDELPEDACCKEELPSSQKEASYASVVSVERTKSLVVEALEFYGLADIPPDNFFVRNEGEGRNVYLVSDGVRNALATSPDVRALIAGVRVFDENRFLKSSSCSMRLCQEGVQWLGPLMRRRCCPSSPEEFLHLLDGSKVNFTDLAEDSELRKSLESLDAQGSVAISCSLACGARLFASAERGAECVSLFVNQHELRELREAVRGYLCPPSSAAVAASSAAAAAAAAA